MTYVYVLVSSAKDLYYEQAVMSLWSLRLYMKKAKAVVLTDDRTAESFTGKRSYIKKLATKIISIPFDDAVRNIERSRLIKTSIPEYVQGDFLYIDCDTVICDDLSSIKDFPYETAGVLDGHVLLDEHIHAKTFLARDKKLGFCGTKAEGFNFNGGLILARDSETARTLFKTWNEVWKYSAYEKHDFHDQSALNEANYRTGLKMNQLPGEWNCQPAHGGLAFLEHAKIIHYYSSEIDSSVYIPYYKLADKQILNRVRDSETIPDDICEMLRTPKFQFNKVHILSDKRIESVMQSPILFTFADMKAHCPRLFRFFEVQAEFARSVGKKLKHRK